MCNCRDIEPKLAEYVDGTQPLSDRAAVDAHLESCPPCRARATGEHAARTLVCSKRDSLRATAPGGLRERCAAQQMAARRSTGAIARRSWVPVSLAASILLAAGLFLVFGWGSSVETYAAQLSADHLKCFQFARAEASSGDLTSIGYNWQRNNGWGLKIGAPSPAEGLQLLGIRRCGSTRGRVAHILYKWRGEPVSVYVLNSRFDHAPDAAHGHDVIRLGEHAIVWTDHDRTYAVVADRRLGDLPRVAAYVRRSIE